MYSIKYQAGIAPRRTKSTTRIRSERAALKRLGRRIRKLRQARGWSQPLLAKKSALNRTFMSDIELGKTNPSLATILVIVRKLNITVSELFKYVA